MRVNSASELKAVMSRGGRSVKDIPAAKRVSTRSKLEADYVAQLERIEVPAFEINYRWHSVREWRWDVAFVDDKVAVEIDGVRRDGKGDHQTEKGMTNDYQKVAEGVLWGWTILRFTRTMVASGEAAELTQRVITRQRAQKGAL